MFNYLTKDRWSPYIVGVFIAFLSVASFLFFQHMIGTSTTFVRLAAAILSLIAPGYIQTNSYYMNYLHNNYWINWQMCLIIGTFIGSYLAGSFYKKSPNQSVPTIWKNRFGKSIAKRRIGAFIGGVIILFGARFAGGCTSGHAITGGMQLAVSGWIFMIGLFAIGVPSALIIYTYSKRK
jgi:hypothetical protein